MNVIEYAKFKKMFGGGGTGGAGSDTEITDYTKRGVNINADITITEDATYNVDFVSNGRTFSQITFQQSNGAMKYGTSFVYNSSNRWGSDVGYRSVYFTGGEDITNPNFVALVKQISVITDEATQIIERSIVEYSSDTAIRVNKSAFYYCTNLKNVYLPNITSIGDNGFYYCSNLNLTSLPSGITSIGSSAFYGCKALTSLTFEGKPTTIATNAFNSCTNLKTINVPWAEGAVANAPWGATNATINYNYTGG